MRPKLALFIILIFSIAGIAFSGYLSYSELVNKACPLAGSCTAVKGIPACVYGLVIYIIVFLASIAGLMHRNH